MFDAAWAFNGQTGAGGLFGALVPLILIFVIFYFLLILPQRKKQREHQEMVKNVKKGDKIVTSGGIYGTITRVKKNYIEAEIASGVVVRVQRGSISALRGGGEE
ncbi:preprotein translocase subunit YajC [Candidatus Aerophobetes bacterium]|nr:preprotein translocase subunit YajC [Candidatus Aerophobetes bacterium]